MPPFNYRGYRPGYRPGYPYRPGAFGRPFWANWFNWFRYPNFGYGLPFFGANTVSLSQCSIQANPTCCAQAQASKGYITQTDVINCRGGGYYPF